MERAHVQQQWEMHSEGILKVFFKISAVDAVGTMFILKITFNSKNKHGKQFTPYYKSLALLVDIFH